MKRWADGLAMLLAAGAVVAAAWASNAVFERIPHLEDEFANLWEAEVMAHGEIAVASPPFPKAFMVPFVVDYGGLRFGKYPPGWPAALSLGVRVGAPWAVNALLAGLAVWLVYRLGTKVAGQATGLVAALLTATSPMLLLLSASLMSHSLGLVLTVSLCLAWFDLFPPPGRQVDVPRWMLVAVAGGALGLLALTRPLTAVGVAIPFGVHGIYLLLRGTRLQRRLLVALGGIAALVASLLLLWQAALTGNPWLNPYVLWWAYDKVGFGPGHGVMKSGHNLHWALINTKFSLRVGQHDLFGWPYLSWIFIPFGAFGLRRRREMWMLAALLPSLILVYAAYWVGAWLYGPRYYFESLGGVAVVSAAGIAWLAGWLGERRSRGQWARSLATGAFVLSLVALNARFYLPDRLRMMTGLYGITRAKMEPLASAHLGRALVIVHPAESWTEYGTLLPLTAPFSSSDLLLAYTRGQAEDEALARAFADRPVYHYYPGDGGKLTELSPQG